MKRTPPAPLDPPMVQQLIDQYRDHVAAGTLQQVAPFSHAASMRMIATVEALVQAIGQLGGQIEQALALHVAEECKSRSGPAHVTCSLCGGVYPCDTVKRLTA